MSEAGKQTAMGQWRRMKDEHPDKILLFRMGDFYETFHDDAVKASRLLGLTLTKRGKEADSPPFAGIPYQQLDRYLKELLEYGEKVSICEQLEDPATAKGVIRRGIVRLVTPGTVFEDECLPSGHNYLAAVCASGGQGALAFADISTGEFRVSVVEAQLLADEWERLRPAETLAPVDAVKKGHLPFLVEGGRGVTLRDGYRFDPREGEARLKARYRVAGVSGFGLADTPAALGAVGALLQYVEETEVGTPVTLAPPRRLDPGNYLLLDRATVRNLELVRPLHEGDRRSTLLSVVDHTKTGPGGRLLRDWLLRPLAKVDAIRRRQEGVGELMENEPARQELRTVLGDIADLERILARAAAERANARDLRALGRSARMLPKLRAMEFVTDGLRELAEGIDPLDDLADLLENAIHDEPPVGLKDGGLIKDGYDAQLDEWRTAARGGKEWIAEFQANEQAESGIPSLKVGFNRVFGYFLEVTNVHRDKVPAHYERKQTLANAERYVTPALKEKEAAVLGAEERAVSREYDLFREIRSQVADTADRVRRTARLVAQLDAAASLAEAGARGRWTIPTVGEGLETTIVGGCHPVVGHLLPSGSFVPNDMQFCPKERRVLIVTGPNMAGKSTYIRQAALLFVLAQAGSAIPAERAEIGLADRVFTRVGAADDLAGGRSTFLVEMEETANILNNASAQSLLVFDEVGRGTSTFDGVSLAWAIAEYLHHKVGARTLFATHYHELAELGHLLPGVKNCHVAVKEWDGEIVFLRKVREGACDRSYGIQVGRLAGIPQTVIERAGEILAGLESQAESHDWGRTTGEREVLRAAAREVQLELFRAPAKDAARAERLLASLRGLDPDRMSPREAHERLCRLIEEAKAGE